MAVLGMVGSTAALIAGTRDSTITSAITSAVKRLRVFIISSPFLLKRFARPAEQSTLFSSQDLFTALILYYYTFAPAHTTHHPCKRVGNRVGKRVGWRKIFDYAQKKESAPCHDGQSATCFFVSLHKSIPSAAAKERGGIQPPFSLGFAISFCSLLISQFQMMLSSAPSEKIAFATLSSIRAGPPSTKPEEAPAAAAYSTAAASSPLAVRISGAPSA